MTTLKINGIEIEYEDSLELSVEDGGKRIVVRGKTPAVKHHYYIQPAPQLPAPFVPLFPGWPTTAPGWPTTVPAWQPFITCGDPRPISGTLSSQL